MLREICLLCEAIPVWWQIPLVYNFAPLTLLSSADRHDVLRCRSSRGISGVSCSAAGAQFTVLVQSQAVVAGCPYCNMDVNIMVCNIGYLWCADNIKKHMNELSWATPMELFHEFGESDENCSSDYNSAVLYAYWVSKFIHDGVLIDSR